MSKIIHVHVHRTRDDLAGDYAAEMGQLRRVRAEIAKLKNPTFRRELDRMASDFYDKASKEYHSVKGE